MKKILLTLITLCLIPELVFSQKNESTYSYLKAFETAIDARAWRESYLQERMQDEIETGQIRVETEGEVITSGNDATSRRGA